MDYNTGPTGEIIALPKGIELSNEWKLMLLLSHVTPDSSSINHAQNIIDSTIDWNSFESLTIKHNLAPLISKHLEKLVRIPEKTIYKFRGIYHHTLRSNILKISETEIIRDGLKDVGVIAISLKGAISSETIFGDVGVYPASDIDILVKPGDIEKARTFLEAAGYKLMDSDFDSYKSYYLKEQYHITFSNGKHAVELHWNLLVRFFSAPPEFWWQDYRVISMGTKEIHLLSPENELLYLSFRLFSKGFYHLKFLLLFAETHNHYIHAINWDKMTSLARHFHMEKVFTFTCLMAFQLLKTPIPVSFIQFDSEKYLYRYALKLLFQGENPKPAKKIPLIFMRDDFKGAFFVLLKNLFPPVAEVAKRYRLLPGTSSIALYYLIHPLLLLMNRHKKWVRDQIGPIKKRR